jgi:uncharacterized protein
VGAFISREVSSHDLEVVQIDLHGGEPLLMPKSAFCAMIDVLVASCGIADCRISIQTNGTLLDQEWIEIFAKYEICLSFSLDGPKDLNDLFRVDKRGRGSYDLVAQAIRIAHKAYDEGLIKVRPGVLCVVNPDYDGAEIYRHLVHDLQFDRLDFLFPDENHGTMSSPSDGRVGQYLVNVFNAWVADDNPKVLIRFVERYLGRLLTSSANRKAEREAFAMRSVVTISSDGHISPDDVLRSAVPEIFADPPLVSQMRLDELAQSDRLRDMLDEIKRLPTNCNGCIWNDVCRGGDQAIHRFRPGSGFDNRSVFCEDMNIMFSQMARFSVRQIIDRDKLLENLVEA